MNTRLLGIGFIVGTIAVTLDGFRTSALGYEGPISDTITNVVYLIWALSGVGVVVGLIKLNALGSNATVRAFGLLPIIGFVVGGVGELLQLGGALSESQMITLSSIAWIFVLAGLLVVGILTVAAKTWQGWRRFVPLVSIAAFPVGLAVGGAVGNSDVGATVIMVFWMLLGYVVATGEPAPVLGGSSLRS